MQTINNYELILTGQFPGPSMLINYSTHSSYNFTLIVCAPSPDDPNERLHHALKQSPKGRQNGHTHRQCVCVEWICRTTLTNMSLKGRFTAKHALISITRASLDIFVVCIEEGCGESKYLQNEFQFQAAYEWTSAPLQFIQVWHRRRHGLLNVKCSSVTNRLANETFRHLTWTACSRGQPVIDLLPAGNFNFRQSVILDVD